MRQGVVMPVAEWDEWWPGDPLGEDDPDNWEEYGE